MVVVEQGTTPSPPLLLLFAASPQILKVVILRTFNHSRKWRFCPASCYRGSAPSISSPKNSTIIPSFPQFKLIPSSLLLKPAELLRYSSLGSSFIQGGNMSVIQRRLSGGKRGNKEWSYRLATSI